MKFDKSLFEASGPRSERWLHYRVPGEAQARFVARFKYGSASSRLKSFRDFMIENISVEDYFSEHDAGKAPLQILNARGYISPNQLKSLGRACARTAPLHFVTKR